MKFILKTNREIFCYQKDNPDLHKVIGFTEKEPNTIDGVVIKHYSHDEDEGKVVPYSDITLSLQDLQILIITLSSNRHSTKDQLQNCQLYRIENELYNNNILKSVQAESCMNTKICESIIAEAYSEGHSGGFSDVINKCYDFIEFAKVLMKHY